MTSPFSSWAKGQKCRPHTLQILVGAWFFLRLPPMTVGVPTFHKNFWWITCNKLLKLLKNQTSEIHIAAKSHVVAATASLDDCTTCAGLRVFGQPLVRLLVGFFAVHTGEWYWVKGLMNLVTVISGWQHQNVSKKYGKNAESMSQRCQWFWMVLVPKLHTWTNILNNCLAKFMCIAIRS